GTNASLNAVSFTDANTGTAVGRFGTIVRTTDGGATWTPQVSGTDLDLNGVSFTDANVGTAVGGNIDPEGDSRTILRTTDGGPPCTHSIRTPPSLFGPSITDAPTGTAVGEGGTILRTTDGGATWTPQSSGTNLGLNGISFTDVNTGTA